MPRGQRQRQLFSDSTAEVVWAAICALDEGLQHEVLRQLRERLAAADIRETPQQQRLARAIAALREAADKQGRSPSVGEYRRLRVDHPEWPPDGSVRRWLGGSWNTALKRAHLDAERVGDALVEHQGPGFSKDEVTAALREAAEDLASENGDGCLPTVTAYLAWARRPDVRRRSGRRPRSLIPFQRLFGGYLPALVAAGLANDEAATGIPRSTASRAASGYRYTDAQLFAAMDEVVACLDDEGRLPTVVEYQRLRQEILDAGQAEGRPPRALASWNVFHRRFGSWGRAQHAYRNARNDDE